MRYSTRHNEHTRKRKNWKSFNQPKDANKTCGIWKHKQMKKMNARLCKAVIREEDRKNEEESELVLNYMFTMNLTFEECI